MEKMKVMLLAAFGLFYLLFLGGCGQEAVKTARPPVVRTQQISLDNSAASATYAGEVRGRYESQLAFQVGGKIMARHVELGSRVQAGDVLMEIDAKDIVQTVHSGAAQVESARAQLNLAQANLSRYRQLYAEAAVSAVQYEQYQTNYDAAQAAYKQAQAQYAQGSNALAYTRLTADGDGVIAAIDAEVGQVTAAGQTVLTLVKAGELEVEINVPENRLADMQVGEPVTVAFWALQQVKVSGVVRELAPIADKVTRTYKARIALLDPPDKIQLGMTASVKGKNGSTESSVLLPLNALYQTGDQPQVWVVQDNQVRLRKIEIAAFGDNQVQVISGLQSGDVVVVAGVHKLAEGQEVRLTAGEGK